MFYLNYQIKQKNYVTGIRNYTDYVIAMRKAMDNCKGCFYMSGENKGMPYCGLMCADIIDICILGDCTEQP